MQNVIGLCMYPTDMSVYLHKSIGKKRATIVEWLGNATTAAHSDALASRHPKSGNWLLVDPRFTDWMLAEHSSFLWLSGIGVLSGP